MSIINRSAKKGNPKVIQALVYSSTSKPILPGLSFCLIDFQSKLA